jgi:hypothetical protein
MFTSLQKPSSTNMFASVVAPVQNDLDTYNFIQTQLNTIKSVKSFTTLTEINPSEFTTISNLSNEILERLSDLSLFYIKKINDETISAYNIDKYKIMYNIHNEMIEKLLDFNDISNEYSGNLKHISSLNLPADQAKFTFEEIFNRYKLKLVSIITDIKKIHTLASLLKK